MIRGKYIAQLQLDFNISSEHAKDYVCFDELRHAVLYGDLTKAIEKLITSELGEEEIACSVTQIHGNLYEEENHEISKP